MSVNEISNLNLKNLDKNFYNKEVINNDITVINQMVDTLKLHFYVSHDLTDKQIKDYNMFVDDCKELKHQAQSIKNDMQDARFIKTTFGNKDFHVMSNGASGGFSINLKNADIDILLRTISTSHANPIIKIEFRSEYLARHGYIFCINQVRTMLNTILPHYKIKVSEIHLATDIQGYQFTKLDLERVRCRNRTKTRYIDTDNRDFSQGSKFTSMSFGKGALMLRIYDKTEQIKKVLKASYVKTTRWLPNELYKEDEPVWRVEFQFRREHLKTLIGKDGILDGFEVVLNSIADLWAYGISRFVHHDLSRQQCLDMITGDTMHHDKLIPLSQYAISKRYQRANISNLWFTISSFNNTFKSQDLTKYQETKKPEVQYLVNSYKGVITTTTKLLRGGFDSNVIAEIITQFNEEELEKKGLSILNSAKLKSVDYMNKTKFDIDTQGLVIDGFKEYERDLKNNIQKTFNIIETQHPEQANKFFDECVKKGLVLKSLFSKDIEDFEFYSF